MENQPVSSLTAGFSYPVNKHSNALLVWPYVATHVSRLLPPSNPTVPAVPTTQTTTTATTAATTAAAAAPPQTTTAVPALLAFPQPNKQAFWANDHHSSI